MIMDIDSALFSLSSILYSKPVHNITPEMMDILFSLILLIQYPKQ